MGWGVGGSYSIGERWVGSEGGWEGGQAGGGIGGCLDVPVPERITPDLVKADAGSVVKALVSAIETIFGYGRFP